MLGDPGPHQMPAWVLGSRTTLRTPGVWLVLPPGGTARAPLAVSRLPGSYRSAWQGWGWRGFFNVVV